MKKEVLSGRVDPLQKELMIKLYGKNPIEHMVKHEIDHKFKTKINDVEKEFETKTEVVSTLNSTLDELKKQIESMTEMAEKITQQIHRTNQELELLSKEKTMINNIIQQYSLLDEQAVQASLNRIIEKLEENRKKRTQRPTPPLQKNNFKIYSEAAGITLDQMMQLVPQEYGDCWV